MSIARLPIWRLVLLLVAIVALSACGTSTPTPTAVPTLVPVIVPTVGATATRILIAPTLVPTAVSSLTPTRVPATPTLAITPTVPAAGRLPLTLGPGRDGTQAGTAVLIAQGDKTEVTLTMQGGEAGVVQPAHIHEGTCPSVGAIKYPLTNVVAGKSVTVVNVPLGDLLKGGLAINVHKSTAEATKFVACSNLVLPPSK